MKKYAVIFGLNYPGSGNDLNGCLNDAAFWQNYAQQKGFDSINVMLNNQCSKMAMVTAINDALNKSQPDDLVIIAYSGHGTIIPPGSQSLVPDDFSFDLPSSWLTYDELDRIYLPHEIRGVKIVAIHDSCHSKANPLLHWRAMNSHPTKNRFLEPPPHITERITTDALNKSVLTSPKGAVLLSGCMKQQTSADAYIDNAYHGAFTYSLSTALSNPSINYFDAVLRARAWLASNGYDQVPGADGDMLFKQRAFFE